MHSILRGLLVLATVGSVSFPSAPPASVTSSTTQQAARRRAAVPGTPAAPTKAHYAANQVEAYLSDDGIAYVRPGLKIKVNSVTIGSDRRPVVDLTLTDDMDQPLDRNGKTTPGVVSISCIMAYYDPAVRQYTAYTTRTVTTPANSPRPGVTAVQAGTDANGSWTDLATGWAKYTFKTALPSGYDVAKTHTLGIYATRNLTDIIGKTYYANVEYDFRPDGAKVTETWDKFNLATSCNNCHDPLALHGGSRRDPKLCALCHQPQTSDPDTGNTVDLKVMVHKIHRGDNLPSVKAGKPYQIIGFNQSVVDFSTVALPMDIRNCDRCHEGTNASAKPAQSNVWYTNPSRAACGSCHDDINWETGENHPAGAMKDDQACAVCHIPDSGKEFDASIKGAHMLPLNSKQLQGIKASIVSVTNATPGKQATVVFSLKNNDGTAIDGNKLSTFSPIQAGSTNSYYWYKRDNAIGKATFDATAGTTSYTFIDAIPADAKGTFAFSVDIRRNVNLKRADGGADIAVRESVINPFKYVSLSGGTPQPRRFAVTIAQCNTCHAGLSLHGGQRNTTEECVICHNPTMTATVTAGGANEGISFQRMIHRIHKGEELTQDFTIGNTNFNEVRFPGDITNCAKCHNGSSYTLPLPTGIASVSTPRDYFTPQGPGTAACLGCHDNRDAAAHAYLNTATFPGGTEPAEACATCHGTGKDWAVEKVHAR
ncbi:MAG TPA: OmcA/MtrC family decaheme c-type cytochrome [Thermoanaerobaculia bacterium]|nr:OmcA/MtrC family decaheme c-type cytochrome [Thermoanaerobaculia bacterium]